MYMYVIKFPHRYMVLESWCSFPWTGVAEVDPVPLCASNILYPDQVAGYPSAFFLKFHYGVCL